MLYEVITLPILWLPRYYHKYLKVKEGELAEIKEYLDPLLEKYNYRVDDVEERKEDFGIV